MGDFDIEEWCQTLSARLADLAATPRPRIAPNFPGAIPVTGIFSVEEAEAIDLQNFRLFVGVAQEHPFWRSRFLNMWWDANDEKTAPVCAVLRSHPVISACLNPRDGNSVRSFQPLGISMSLSLPQLALRLATLTFLVGVEDAARLLARFISEGEEYKLAGYEITLFVGLRIDRRINIDDGLFLAPYEEVSALYGPHPRLEVSDDARPDPISPKEFEFLRGNPGHVTALVREFRWGPSVGPPDNTPNRFVARPLYATKWDLFLPVDDIETFRALMVIATDTHQLSWVSYIVTENWLADIDPNYALGDVRYYRSHADDWWSANDPPEGWSDRFQSMVQQRRNYEGDKERLDFVISRIAASYSRAGRFRVADSIADIAIALEAMYRPESPEVTHKLRTRAAFLLEPQPEKRKDIFEQVNSFYGARSRIVHGSSLGGRQSSRLATDRDMGRDIAKRTLLALLDRGPISDWDDFVLSAGEATATPGAA